MTVIHIDGVQGSGKSYVCSKLKNIICIDTDDIISETTQIIHHHKLPNTLSERKKITSKLVQSYIEKHDKIVFVGMTLVIPNPTYKFFIKITDLKYSYKRLLLRELDKIMHHSKEIKKHIHDTDAEDMVVDRIANISMLFPIRYNYFVDNYKLRLQEAIKNNYVVKTQDQIIDIINHLDKYKQKQKSFWDF
jgi:cytidylate kinase